MAGSAIASTTTASARVRRFEVFLCMTPFYCKTAAHSLERIPSDFLSPALAELPPGASAIGKLATLRLGAGALDNFERLARRQSAKRRVRLGLIPEGHRRDVVLQREVRTVGAPAERLDRHAQVVLEPDRIHEVPAVEAEALLRLVQAIGPRHERQPRVRRAEFLVALRVLVLEVVRPAEVVLGARAADRRELDVAIHEELDFALPPPTVVVHAPAQVR